MHNGQHSQATDTKHMTTSERVREARGVSGRMLQILLTTMLVLKQLTAVISLASSTRIARKHRSVQLYISA